jgi:hypothetical protein
MYLKWHKILFLDDDVVVHQKIYRPGLFGGGKEVGVLELGEWHFGV